ncbi:hypothetical protein GCM10022402_36560 [Salinactinospora qingdaonensis]|uniref:Uncharacterized protein n=1 Tax=Salinactinospora qingdaonensis TaxID=702744 RepID=A0ABP7G420_9ACTN
MNGANRGRLPVLLSIGGIDHHVRLDFVDEMADRVAVADVDTDKPVRFGLETGADDIVSGGKGLLVDLAAEVTTGPDDQNTHGHEHRHLSPSRMPWTWRITQNNHETSYTDREGNPATRTDNTLKLRRRDG